MNLQGRCNSEPAVIVACDVAREPLEAADLVRFQSRQYSLDGRRCFLLSNSVLKGFEGRFFFIVESEMKLMRRALKLAQKG